MNEYPSDWRNTCLEEIAEVRTGIAKNTKSEVDGVELPYMRVANVQDGYLDLTEVKSINVDKEKAKRYTLMRGDVLVNEGGDIDKVGRGVIWRGEIANCLHQNHIFSVRCSEHLLPEYLSYYLGSTKGKEYFLRCAKQTTNLASINSTQLRSLPLSLPPLPEQKKIAEILSGIDQTITKLDSQKTKYDRLFASMLSEVYADLHKSHEIRRIGEICEVKRGASPRPIQSKKWWGDGRGWTRISDVTKSKKYLYKTKDRLSPEGEQRSVPINPGSIILSICATIGLPVIPKIPVCIHDGFVWFEGIEKEILPEFAYYFFLSVRDELVSGRQTGTQGNLNTSIVSQQLIPIPPQSEQKRIIKLMSDMEFQAEKINRKIQSHKNLKSSLSSDLLSGRKRVSV